MSLVQSGGSCITSSGSRTNLKSAFSVARVFSSSHNETQFIESAKSDFLDFLGISACSAEVTSTGLVSSPVSLKSPTSLTLMASLPSSSISLVSSSSLRTRTKIIVGTTILISLIALLNLGILSLRKYRASQRACRSRKRVHQGRCSSISSAESRITR